MKRTFAIVPLAACLLFAGDAAFHETGKASAGGSVNTGTHVVTGSGDHARTREIILYPNGKRARKMVCRIPLNAQDTVH